MRVESDGVKSRGLVDPVVDKSTPLLAFSSCPADERPISDPKQFKPGFLHAVRHSHLGLCENWKPLQHLFSFDSGLQSTLPVRLEQAQAEWGVGLPLSSGHTAALLL